jgi:hypothetical protein
VTSNLTGTSAQSYNAAASPLTASTQYWFCAIANNSAGTSFGTVLSFTTTAGGGSSISYAGERAAKTAQTPGIAFSPTTGTAAGDLLVLILGSSGSNGVATSVTDSVGNVWHQDVRLLANNQGFGIYSTVLTNPITTSNTIMLTGGDTQSLLLEEFSGIVSSSWTDKTATNSNAGPSSALDAGTTAATSQASELVIGGWSQGNNSLGAVVPGSGYSVFATDPLNSVSGGRSLFVEYKIVSVTGAQNPTATSGVTNKWSGGVSTYRGV